MRHLQCALVLFEAALPTAAAHTGTHDRCQAAMRGNCQAAMRGKILEETQETPGSTLLIVGSMNPPLFLPFPFFNFITGNSGLNGSPHFPKVFTIRKAWIPYFCIGSP